MHLKKFYSLRTDFTVIGLTGRVGSGCSEVARKLSSENFVNDVYLDTDNSNISESAKSKICYEFLKFPGNWSKFVTIHYKNVLVLHLVHESNRICSGGLENVFETFLEIISQNGKSTPQRENWSNRIDNQDDQSLIYEIRNLLKKNKELFLKEQKLGSLELNACLKDNEKLLYEIFFESGFDTFCKDFYEIINRYDVVKRTRLTHDLANNLRASGSVRTSSKSSIEYTYTIAETINRIIKCWKNNSKNQKTKVVIDSLKNSLELMYFKEKYSAFYMIATHKSDVDRKEYISSYYKESGKTWGKSSIEIDKIIKNILDLDEAEHKTGDHKRGVFSTPDIENCIQKSDYHISISKDKETSYLTLDLQLIRLIALITQPGIVTPTNVERSMQLAYNAKFNSGCISRQVGAVVTDSYYSVKAIGWNDVPSGQMPCNLRSIKDLLSDTNQEIFSDYEKGTFKEKIELSDNYEKSLNGRNCSFCFKAFQNAIDGEKNQVHTRSLHAEENAMMQIAKYGGQPLTKGNLFTTASPCELCSKKAFQLGIKNIYYIDPYPGIAVDHTLKNGVNRNGNPMLIMFQGAVGRAFHKLYEPFMAYKDELTILTGINPKTKIDQQLKDLDVNKDLKEKLTAKLANKTEIEKKEILEKLLEIGLSK